MNITSNLYRGLSALHCYLYLFIWFGLSIVVYKTLTQNPEIGFGKGFFLLALSVLPFSNFRSVGRSVHEIGIYQFKFILGLPWIVWLPAVLGYLSGIILLVVFWSVNRDFPNERIYSTILFSGMLFSITLGLLHWYLRLRGDIWSWTIQVCNSIQEKSFPKESADEE